MRSLIFLACVAPFIIIQSAHAAGPEVWNETCHVIKLDARSKSQCKVRVYANAFSFREIWNWNNGSKTLVKGSKDGLFVNDLAADELKSRAVTGKKGVCFRVRSTKNIYCRTH